MPGKVRVKIVAGRNLPVMDRSSDTTDAFVEVKLANVTYKTDVYKKSLNPHWNSDFYRFEVIHARIELHNIPCFICFFFVCTERARSLTMPNYKTNIYKSD